MCAMSLSVGLLIDITCTSIREFEYCLKENLNEDESIWNKMTCCITKAVEAVDDAVDDALEAANIKEESSDDENGNKQENHENGHGDDHQNNGRASTVNGGVELAIIPSNSKQKDS